MIQQQVFTCHHTMQSGSATRETYSELIFVDGEPMLVLSWAAREPDRQTDIAIRLNHKLLRISPDDDTRHSDYTYAELVTDPRQH